MLVITNTGFNIKMCNKATDNIALHDMMVVIHAYEFGSNYNNNDNINCKLHNILF